MKAKVSLLFFTVLSCFSMAFAVNGTGYYNLVKKAGFGSTTLVLKQDKTSCTSIWAVTYGETCVASVKDTPANLASMLKTKWVDNANVKGISLELGSDIDLGEFSATTEVGKCDVNHVPLPLQSSNMIDGKGFTVSHLCYAKKVTEDDPMTAPVGLFEKAYDVTIQNFKLNGARIYIDGESGNGADYYPVGGLVGTVELATLNSIELANDSILAPIAGGLAGYVENSTIKHVKGNDDIYVTNKTAIVTGYAGSEVVKTQPKDYKVFLGGLVGVDFRNSSKTDPSFENDSVKVEVHDFAKGHMSALGGIAGFFSTTGETVENVHVYSKYKTDETVSSKISGGAAMGGLFGARMTPSTGKAFKLLNSQFDGLISEASSSELVAVGGLIGLDSTFDKSVKIEGSIAKVSIADALKNEQNYRYFAGGAVGYGGSCGNGGTDVEAFLSISNTKTSGSIEVAASGAEVGDIHVQTFLGGLVGSACFAQDENLGLVNDTSSVVISAKVKTSDRDVYNTNTRDTVFVGGIVGFMNVAVANKSDTLSGLLYTGSISVEDSLSDVFIGGVVGGFTQSEGGKSLYFRNVVVGNLATDNANLITYKAVPATTAAASKQLTKIGGVCGVCKEISMMDRVGVKGNVSATGAYAGDSLIVGGLVGWLYSNTAILNVKNSFVNGDIKVDALVGDGKRKLVGYLIGDVALYYGIEKGYEIKSSYHYGENDLSDAPNPFGEFEAPSLLTDWKVSDNIHYVVRNGDAADYTPAHHNGTELATAMKKSSFAGFLNKAYGIEENDKANYAWTFVSGKNSDLPIFSDDANLPIEPGSDKYVVSFVVSVGDYSKTVKQDMVEAKHSATEPTAEEMPEVEGYTFKQWDKAFDNIVSDLTVNAVYDINYYKVKFLDGLTEIGKTQTVKYLDAAVEPKALGRKGYTFVGWDDSSFTQVKKDLEINAVYEANKYLIVFEDYDGTVLYEDYVAYGTELDVQSITPTREPTEEYEYTFSGWTPELAVVSGEAVYKATYTPVKLEQSSSSTAESSSSEALSSSSVMSSSSVALSSSSVMSSSSVVLSSSSETSSSSVVLSSSSEKALSSSSVSSSSAVSSSSVKAPVVKKELKLVEPKIEQSGNAIRLTFNAENADSETVARVVVTGENGAILDTVISKSVIDGGVWEMTPAPMGKFSVELSVDNQVQKATFESDFEVESEIVVRPESWQMVSLTAMDRAKMIDDSDVYFYWWDEHNPVGEFWQYRSFTGGDAPATRGFWYGTSDGKPLVLRESTGSKDSEIVWELDSLYSGWNLVANPYGWYVDLTKGKASNGEKVTFWRWNPATAEYEIPTVIGPYEAVWAKVKGAVTWKASAAPVFGIVEKKEVLRKESSKESGSWNVAVSLSDDYGKKDSWNVIGAGSAESLDKPPAGMGNRVSLAIRAEEKGAKLAKSVKPVSDEYHWTLDVSANTAREGSLSFDGVSELHQQGLKLYVTVDGETTEVSEEKSVKVALAKASKQVDVHVAATNMAVSSSTIRGLRSAVMGNQLQVSFEAPEKLAGATSVVQLVGLDGKVLATYRGKSTAGLNSAVLNAPKSGLYLVRVHVGNEQAIRKVAISH